MYNEHDILATQGLMKVLRKVQITTFSQIYLGEYWDFSTKMFAGESNLSKLTF